MNRILRICGFHCLLLASILSLSGCYSQTGEKRSAYNYGSQKDAPPEQPRAYGTQQPGDIMLHGNTKLDFSQSLTDKVVALDGVNSAIVMLTDRNAYAAILIDNTATGTRGANSRKETNNSGTSLGSYNPFTFSQYADPNQLATGYNNYETVEHHADISHHFKQKIAETIRLANPAVHDVYISANRDFINQLNAYAQESWKGNSLSPYVHDFNASVNRIFGVPNENTNNK